MTPEAADYLRKAREDLSDARKVAAIGLAKVAARAAYYTAFHTAEAFIVERTGQNRENAFWASLGICEIGQGRA